MYDCTDFLKNPLGVVGGGAANALPCSAGCELEPHATKPTTRSHRCIEREPTPCATLASCAVVVARVAPRLCRAARDAVTSAARTSTSRIRVVRINWFDETTLTLDLKSDGTLVGREAGTSREHNLYDRYTTEELQTWTQQWSGRWKQSGTTLALDVVLGARTCTHTKKVSDGKARATHVQDGQPEGSLRLHLHAGRGADTEPDPRQARRLAVRAHRDGRARPHADAVDVRQDQLREDARRARLPLRTLLARTHLKKRRSRMTAQASSTKARKFSALCS